MIPAQRILPIRRSYRVGMFQSHSWPGAVPSWDSMCAVCSPSFWDPGDERGKESGLGSGRPCVPNWIPWLVSIFLTREPCSCNSEYLWSLVSSSGSEMPSHPESELELGVVLYVTLAVSPSRERRGCLGHLVWSRRFWSQGRAGLWGGSFLHSASIS